MWTWLKRIWQQLKQWLGLASPEEGSHANGVAIASSPEPDDLAYEHCLFALLDAIADRQAGWGALQGICLVRGIDSDRLAAWLADWGQHHQMILKDDQTLVERLAALGTTARGPLAASAGAIARQFASPPPPKPASVVIEAEFLDDGLGDS